MADDGILGLLGRMNDPQALYGGALSDPATRQAMAGHGLLAMAGSFADSAMPTRMPTPFGAVLGHAAGAAGASDDALMAARLQNAQAQQAMATAALNQGRADIIKGLPGDMAAYYGLDPGGGGIPSAPPPGTVPGTVGMPTVSTASINTGRGPDGVIIPPGTPTATHDPKLSGSENLNNLAQAAAPIALPGYRVEMTSGNRPGATVAGTGGASQHATANAADFKIFGPDGKEIPNDVADTTGSYAKLAVVMRAIASPDIKPWLAWGGNFGKTDIQHFDFAGDRGTAGSLAAMERNLAANASPGAGGAPQFGAPSTVRGSWFGNAPGWSDKNDRGPQANGQPVSAGPGIALPIPKDSPDFGKWYDVTAPNGQTLRLQQTDVGPGPGGKGRGLDVNAVAAGQFGYNPSSFPTDGAFRVAPAGARPPDGGGPVRMAQANTGTITDAPPSLLAQKGPVPGPAPAVGAPPSPAVPVSLLAPQGAPPPPLSPNTIATLKAGGMTDEQIARVAAAPSGPQPGPGPVAPLPSGAPPPPPGPPQPLVTAPPPTPPGPPLSPGPPQPLVTPPQPPPPVPPAAAAPAGAIPGAPSVAKQQAASRLMLKFAMAGIPLPPDVEATAKFGLTVAQAAAVAAAKSPIEVAQAVAIANGTLPADIAKARAGPAESGAQARTTYGDEMVEIPGLGWTQRKNLPGFTMAGGGGGGGGGAAPAPAVATGPGTPAPGPTTGASLPPGPSPAVGGPVVLAPSTTPAQAKLFESNLAQATEQLKPLRAEGLAAPTEIGRADEINDLLGRTKMGWGADTRQRGGMILQALGATPGQIKSFLDVDTTAGATLNKLFLQFSSDAVLRLGSHEAASVLGQFAKAYPSLESDPRAAELMTNALRMQAQYKLDRANAAEAWDLNQQKNMGPFGQNYRGMNGFHAAFNQTNDFNDYWRAAAAMSGFADIAWRGTSEADQHRILALIPSGRVLLDPSGASLRK